MKHLWPFRSRLAGVVVALWACLLGCGGAAPVVGGSFWLRAAPDPVVELAPRRALPAPGVVQSIDIEGTVAEHNKLRGGAQDFELVIARGGLPPLHLHYRMGRHRALPYLVGDFVHLRVLRRRRAADDGIDVGLLAFKRVASAVQTGDEGELRVSEVLLAVVNMRDIVDRSDVPVPLRSLRRTDVSAYHEAGTFRGECEEVRAHRHFRAGRPEWLRGNERAPHGRLLPPGSRVVVDDGHARFDVVLLDNRVTTSSNCDDVPEATWAWAALRVDRQTEASEAAVKQPADPENAPDAGKAPTQRPTR